jgi:hypothetical protein
MRDYSTERTRTPPGYCDARASLGFDGTTLTFRAKGVYSCPAASGERIGGAFKYTPDAQREGGKGPIPEGTYWIRPDEMWNNSWFHVLARRSSWGNHRITIHPFSTTETFGRGGFFIHGGDVLGSRGCIDLTFHMDRFFNDLKAELGGLPGCQIQLIVKYPRGG